MIFGTDFAVINEHVKDWVKFKTPLDLQFAFFRLTQGYNIYDNIYTIKAEAEGARSVGMLTAGWHQFDPTQSAIIQMDNFCRSWDTQSFELRPILAVESGTRVDWAAVPASVQTPMLEQCVDILTKRIYAPMMYTRQEYWDSHVQPRPLWNTLVPWMARYKGINLKQAPTMLSPWADGYHEFRDWPDYDKWFWQYTDKGLFPGAVVSPTNDYINANIDLDAFNGTREDLNALKMVTTPVPQPEVTLEAVMAKVSELITVTNNLNDELYDLKLLHNGFVNETVTNRNSDKAEYYKFVDEISKRLKAVGDGL